MQDLADDVSLRVDAVQSLLTATIESQREQNALSGSTETCKLTELLSSTVKARFDQVFGNAPASPVQAILPASVMDRNEPLDNVEQKDEP